MAKKREAPNDRDESILKQDLDEEKFPGLVRRKVQLPSERVDKRLRKFRPVDLESDDQDEGETEIGKSSKRKRRKKESADEGNMDELAKVLGRAMLGMLAASKKEGHNVDLNDENLDFFADDDDDDDDENELDDDDASDPDGNRSQRVFTPNVALKNTDAERLPEVLDFSVDDSEDNASPTTFVGSEGELGQHSWGEKAGGTEVAKQDNATFLVGLVREIPLINRLLIKDDQWRSAPFLIVVASIVAVLLTAVTGIVIKDHMVSKKTPGNPRVSHGSEKVLHNLEALQEALDRFFGAQTWQEMLATVRNPDQVSAKMERHYREREITPSKEVVVVRKSSSMIGDTPCVSIRVLLKPSFKEQWVVLFRDGIDSYKVDWEDAVRYQDLSWKEIVSTKPTSPVKVRARLNQISYYNFEFEDANRFQSFQIEDPEREISVYGYAERTDPITEKLLKLTEKGPKGVFLSIAFPMNASTGTQVRIVDLVAENWVTESKSEDLYDYSKD